MTRWHTLAKLLMLLVATAPFWLTLFVSIGWACFRPPVKRKRANFYIHPTKGFRGNEV